VLDIGFSLEAGQGLGIIGASGSGKSTIARALTGIWPALRGDIRFDGAERGHYDPQVLGRAIGYLPQEVELFDGTIAENISRFEQPAGSAGILAAAKASGTHQLIAALPDGYDTRIGPRGTALSAGQRQRVGLARALYGDPMLLVLDEPNANLDHEGELALVEALGAAKARGAIVILVAHRPSAIVATEKLLVVANGRQVAYGDREDVLKRVLKQPFASTEAVRSHG
jgi:ATP-binding cassette, subfamily C, bacterial PrsD